MIIQRMHKELHGVAKLTHLGLIRAQGEDAAKFLHGQLTNDFSLLGLSEARLAGFCNAKGRLLVSFIGFKLSPNDILLLCSGDLLMTTLKRLQMFVMRAKLKLTDASAEFEVFGLSGNALVDASKSIATYSNKVWTKHEYLDGSLIILYPADGMARALWVAPLGASPPNGEHLTPAQWAWGEVRSGIATVTQPISEMLVPQMLNFESIGGVNFKKGCYPGQEIVARSQFRGTLKRRAYLAASQSHVQAGEELFTQDNPTQPCGVVVQVAATPKGGYEAIVSMQISAFEAGGVHAGNQQGPALALTATPYPLLADI